MTAVLTLPKRCDRCEGTGVVTPRRLVCAERDCRVVFEPRYRHHRFCSNPCKLRENNRLYRERLRAAR